MLVSSNSSKRLVVAVTSAVVLAFVFVWVYSDDWRASTTRYTKNAFSSAEDPSQNGRQRQQLKGLRPSKSPSTMTAKEDGGARKMDKDMSATHVLLKSVSTKDQEYFIIDFGQEAINPNIIPHRTWNDTWIIVAQQGRSHLEDSIWTAELVCDATFKNDGLRCIDPPLLLPISATFGDNCVGELEFFRWNVGPHDARVFYGPDSPYTIYGSRSDLTCFGMWMQDFRLLVDWGWEQIDNSKLRRPTELQRPFPYRQVEKNWFVFWDRAGQMYAHYDVSPKRVFAQLNNDGSIGPDLASHANPNDGSCMTKHMPAIAPKLESVHQATNSLRITTCARHDPACVPDDTNTFILTIFQHKSYYSFHSVYEPYAMLFRQSAPFDLHAIGTKPLWISGRGYARKPTSFDGMDPDEERRELENWAQTEMFYVTSISWRDQGMKYHGYADDVMFVSFGIEDQRTGGIDVLAGDMLQDLGLCAEVGAVDVPGW